MNKRQKPTVAVYYTIVNLFKNFADFVIRGSKMMSEKNFLQIMSTVKLHGKNASTAAENIEAIIRHLPWIWESEIFIADKYDAIKSFYTEYLAFLNEALVINCTETPSEEIIDFLKAAESVDIKNYQETAAIVKAGQGFLKAVKSTEGSQRKKYRVGSSKQTNSSRTRREMYEEDNLKFISDNLPNS